MEELIHCYQYQRRKETGGRFPTLNDELEAKVGWLTYLERYGRSLTESQAKAILGPDYMAISCFADWVGGFGTEITPRSKNEMLYDLFFDDARKAMRLKYSDKDHYPFSETLADRELQNLFKLLENC